jgi:hypothetical protein
VKFNWRSNNISGSAFRQDAFMLLETACAATGDIHKRIEYGYKFIFIPIALLALDKKKSTDYYTTQ